jgi:hypothetical protein
MRPYYKYLVSSLLILISAFSLKAQTLPKEFIDPPHEFSVMPFWFWNDTLKDDEIVRQIADFEAHGVYGFVIHPRIGLPSDIKWLSPEMLHSMDVAIREAEKRNMYVVLYDEGMYPSGSSSGQVVGKNPAFAARGLAKIDLKAGQDPVLTEGMKLVTTVTRPDGSRVAVVELPSKGVIRGLHYTGDENRRPGEETPPAGDILNPDAVSCFIDLVYEKYATNFSRYFGKTILGVFTDEPSPLGRSNARGVVPGNAALLSQIRNILGYDITPFLADLWYNDNPDSRKHRNDYNRAINTCLEENYYKRLGNWCLQHNISLMGHPAGSMDIGAEKYFQIPGQDLVWRYVEAGPKALEGQHSTMAKCASSAMLHQGSRRNLNELYGAYGHDLTFEEMKWLADWCFVRGQNLLIPHAFFYSVRGPRYDERPPDVGPHASWWNDFRGYADACRRLSWLNTDSRQICEVAVLSDEAFLPDKPAKKLFQNQIDFNYLETRLLGGEATVNKDGIRIAGMTYSTVIIDTLGFIPDKVVPLIKKLAKQHQLIINSASGYASLFKGAVVYSDYDGLIRAARILLKPDLVLTNTSEGIRYRHVEKNGDDYYLLFNEEEKPVSSGYQLPVAGRRFLVNPETAITSQITNDEVLTFKPHELKIIWIPGNN